MPVAPIRFHGARSLRSQTACAIVTGVSRHVGIAATIARQMLLDGASVLARDRLASARRRPAVESGPRPTPERPSISSPQTSPRLTVAFTTSRVTLPIPIPELTSGGLAVERFGALDIMVACHAGRPANHTRCHGCRTRCELGNQRSRNRAPGPSDQAVSRSKSTRRSTDHLHQRTASRTHAKRVALHRLEGRDPADRRPHRCRTA